MIPSSQHQPQGGKRADQPEHFRSTQPYADEYQIEYSDEVEDNNPVYDNQTTTQLYYTQEPSRHASPPSRKRQRYAPAARQQSSSPPPSPSPQAKRQRTMHTLSSLPLPPIPSAPRKDRSQPVRRAFPTDDDEAIWSTLPARKQNGGRGGNRRSGVKTTGRFTLPIQLRPSSPARSSSPSPAGPGNKSGLGLVSSVVGKKLYRPPPRRVGPAAVSGGNGTGDDAQSDKKDGWRLVMVRKPML